MFDLTILMVYFLICVLIYGAINGILDGVKNKNSECIKRNVWFLILCLLIVVQVIIINFK